MTRVVAVRNAVLTFLLFAWIGPACSQSLQLSNLASRINKEVKPLKAHLVAVVDFRPADGASAVQGHYLAARLSALS